MASQTTTTEEYGLRRLRDVAIEDLETPRSPSSVYMPSSEAQTPATLGPHSSTDWLILNSRLQDESGRRLGSNDTTPGAPQDFKTDNSSSIDNLGRVTSIQQHGHDVSLAPLERLTSRETQRRVSGLVPASIELATVPGSPPATDGNVAQGVPPELPNILAEVVCIIVCSMGQLFFALLLGNVTVNQVTLISALGITSSQTPWLVGSYLLANGLSVVISGALADLARPKSLMVGAFLWFTVWNVVGCFTISPQRSILFFIVRAMQGLAVGVLVSSSMSVLGRIYKPGIRKTRVFSSMAAMSPFGFWIGTLQGGALSAHLPWIFGSTAVLGGLCALAGYLTIPPLVPAKERDGMAQLSLKDFDYLGTSCAVVGCGLLLFGLTQGSPSGWAPYTYSLIVVAVAFFVAFYLVERKASRPLIDNRLWKTPSFLPLLLSYFLGFGAFAGAWQFYAVRFWLTLQQKSPLTVSLYLIPNAVTGLLATFLVARLSHVLAGHYILTASMVAFAAAPVFFLPQTPNTPYWALSMPGVAVGTFGPDLSFAASSIFITSSVAKTYQGSAGSLLVTMQNLSTAIMTAVGDSIGTRVGGGVGGELTLESLRAIWWFAFGISMLGALNCAVFVRIPKNEEKEHMS